MLHAEVAMSAPSGETVVPIVVAALTVAGAVVGARLNARTDDLERAERLTSVLDRMLPSPERELVEQVRDDHVTTWALAQAAPPHPVLRWSAAAAYWGGLAVLVVGAVYVLIAPGYQWWFWLTYVVGVVLVALGWTIHRLRMARRRDWTAAERERRGIRPPLDGPASPRAGSPPSA